jgi:hypothetical protein
VEIYTDHPGQVNGQADEIEIPAFLLRRPAQAAAAAKPRRRIRPEMWGTLRAALAREHQSLPADSPRLKPTLPQLRLPSEVA